MRPSPGDKAHISHGAELNQQAVGLTTPWKVTDVRLDGETKPGKENAKTTGKILPDRQREL
jgi:hypothetical protein